MITNPLILEMMRKYKLPEDMVKRLLLPDIGEEFILRGLVYRVIYLKEGDCKFSAIPIRTAIPKKAETKMKWFGRVKEMFKR